MTHRYLVFAGEDFYPSGGWSDFRGAFDTLEEAMASAQELKRTVGWVEVVSLEAFQVVWEWDG